MEKLPRPVYSTEFCQQAVALITRDGRGIAEAARRLAVSPKRLTNRVRPARGADLPGAGAAPRREVPQAEADKTSSRARSSGAASARDCGPTSWCGPLNQPSLGAARPWG